MGKEKRKSFQVTRCIWQRHGTIHSVAVVRLKNVNVQHPPDKEYRDNATRDVDNPVTDCFRGAEVEHAAMVAGHQPSGCLRSNTIAVR
jgi:hypothetical protein